MAWNPLAPIALSANVRSLETTFSKPTKPPYPNDPVGNTVNTLVGSVFQTARQDFLARQLSVGASDLPALILLNDLSYASPSQADPQYATPSGIVANHMALSGDLVSWAKWSGTGSKLPKAIAKVIGYSRSAPLRGKLLSLLEVAALPVSWQADIRQGLADGVATSVGQPWTAEEHRTLQARYANVSGSLNRAAAGESEAAMRQAMNDAGGAITVPVLVPPGGSVGPRPNVDWKPWVGLGAVVLVAGSLTALVARRRHARSLPAA